MAYHVVLSQFEGPLDLLLHLLTEAQIDIRDLFISPIVEQYLETVSHLQEADPDRSSEFLELAARLIEMKSRRLLPAEDEEVMAELQEDEEQLFNQLEELRRYRMAQAQLTEMEREAERIYYRLPDEQFTQERIQVQEMSMTALLEAFSRLQHRIALTEQPEEPDAEVERDRFTVEERRAFLNRMLKPGVSVPFSSLFGRHVRRIEVISTFIVLLELVREGHIQVTQTEYDLLLVQNDTIPTEEQA